MQRTTALLLARSIKVSSVVKVEEEEEQEGKGPPHPVDLQCGLLMSVAPGSRANVKPPSRSSLLIYFMAPVSPSPSVPLSVSLVFSDRATLH